MTKSRYEEARSMFLRQCKGAEGTEEIMALWDALLDKPSYHQFVKNWLMLVDGHNPMPDLARYESLIRVAGHEMAAAEVLKPSNLLSGLFRGRVVHKESYKAFHMLVTARLLSGPTTLDEQGLLVLYSTMDRLLRGGPAWLTTDRVPAATSQFYRELSSVSLPLTLHITGALNRMLAPRGCELLGPRYETVATGALSPVLFLTSAIALTHGRNVATLGDALEGARVYPQFFDTDLRSLPLVHREGRSGYEKTA